MRKRRTPPPPKDIAVLQGPTEDGQGARLLRFKEGAVYAGEVRPAREGQELANQELVRLKPMHPRYPVCEVEVLYAPATAPKEQRQAAGPARVSNRSYRRNWNAVFGSSKRKPPSDWSVN